MKDFIKNNFIYVLIALLIIILLAFWFTYLYQFHGGLSGDHSRWSQFGDFFNGVISPIFAAINICIFWYLTKVVDDNNAKRQREMQKKEKELQDEIQRNEDRRRQLDAEHQKAMILMQFRKNEVDKLNEVLLVSKENINNDSFALLLINYGITVENFLKSKLVFFGLNENSMIAKKLQTLHNEFSVITSEYLTWSLYFNYYDNLIKKPDAVNRDVNLQGLLAIIKKSSDELSKHLNTAMELKTSIINELQKITLGETIS